MNFPLVLLTAGLVLLLVGLLGKVKIKDSEFSTDNPRIRVLASLFGVALLIVALLVYRSDRSIPPDNSNSANTNTPPTPPPSLTATYPTPTFTPSPTPTLPKPDMLIEIILKAQQSNVRESYGEFAGQNFTARNLQEFIAKGTLKDITAQLKADSEFLDVVLAIKHMPPSERQKLLNKGSHTYKPTWEQLGEISPKGQTSAGQKAEQMIADAIVNLVKELSQLPDEEIRKLQT
jgi:hypothetical protein